MNLFPSRYLQIFPWPDDPGYLLLYCTKNAAMALVEKAAGARIRQGEVPAALADTLRELGMLVPDPDQEQAEVFDLLAEINRQDVGLNVAVILGLACNFSCTYCYEGTLKKGQTMTAATAAQTVAFLKERYAARHRKRLTLDFYGGEPLLYPDLILNIASPLKTFVEEQGGQFRFSLVTNGSLLTGKSVEQLLPAGLYAAKVTVDGPADEHNRLRPFKSGQPSFDIILANVRACCDLIKIGFGGNYTRDSFPRVVELLDHVAALGFTPAQFGTVQFHPVIAATDSFAHPEFSGGCLSANEPWLAEAALAVRAEVLKRGYPTPKLIPSPCMVDLDDAFVVNHDGKLFKCVALIGHPEYAVGDVWQGQGNIDAYHPGHWRENAECRQCAYLPLCFGGCRYMALQRTGSLQVDCRQQFYGRIIEGTVVQDAGQKTEVEK